MDAYTSVRSGVGGTVLVPAPNLGTAEPPLAIIHNLRASPAAAAAAAAIAVATAVGGKDAAARLNHSADAGATLSRVLPEQNLSQYRLQVPVATSFSRKSTSGDMQWKWSKKRAAQSSSFSETWRIQNASVMELLDKEEVEMEWSSKKKLSQRKAAKAKHKAFTPRAFTLGGKRIEPIHSDEVWFLERLLRILAMIFFVITLPFSLMFCFKELCANNHRFRPHHPGSRTGPHRAFIPPCCTVVVSEYYGKFAFIIQS
ncbi:unnamed protein product [Schistocephalus solidus]|uniref:Uncharacterized protein n=1 Tax=Schistocephalus solidus TaxID=70667 RepID=A0A183TKD6_SCHSO|nr:unnamed protein product [Schistocephalus solidus]